MKLTESILHVLCLAHTINLAVQKALKVKRVNHILAKIRRIAAFFHRSPKANELLKQKALLLSVPDHDLIIDVITRWNSAYDMIARFIEMQCAVIMVLVSKELQKANEFATLTAEEIQLAEEVIRLLKRMKDMTTMLCTEESPTVSMIMPLMHQLKGALSAKDSDAPAVRKMKQIMKEDLHDRYTDQSDILYVASALDPRFKHLPFPSDTQRFDVLNDVTVKTCEANEFAVTRVKTELNEDNDTPALPELPQLPELESDSQPDVPIHNESPVKLKADPDQGNEHPTLLEGILGDVFILRTDPAKTPFELSKLEVDKYVSYPGISLNDSCLAWWKKHEEMFPRLSILAKRLLCISVTSVPSERAFSTAGDIVTHHSLKPQNVDLLLFLKKNLKT
ncbi:E3 SUMO-protein ligase ZBED1-like [Haliotis asinina]|uniref:E3 SUMO-protein ligase ZBED1-like n=1 Tax=Haliotis asinina TaxID=109174 RepID=UPI003531D295